MTTYNYDTLKISKTMRVDGLYDYNSAADDVDGEGNLLGGKNLKNPEDISNQLCVGKSGYVHDKFHVSETGQIFKMSYLMSKDGTEVKYHKTGYSATGQRVDPDEIGLVFQNKPAVGDVPANNEFTGFITGVAQSYYTNRNDLFGDNGIFTKPESINSTIDAAALRTELKSANPSLLKVFKLIFKESLVTENQKLIEETDLYLRYLKKGLELHATNDVRYALNDERVNNRADAIKDLIKTLEPWNDGLKAKADNAATTDADLVEAAAQQLVGSAVNNTIPVLAVGGPEAPATEEATDATAAAVTTTNEPAWNNAQAVADHFNDLLAVIREKEGMEETGAPKNLKDKDDDRKAKPIMNFAVINTGSGPKLVTTNKELPKDPAEMTASDWADIEWHPVKVDFDGFEGYQNKRVNFGKKDAEKEKSSIRIMDRYLHKLAGIPYDGVIGTEDPESDADALVDVEDAPAPEAAAPVEAPAVTHGAFNGFTKANETLAELTTKPINQTDGVNTPIVTVKPKSDGADEYEVVDAAGKPIMIEGRSYPDITSLLIVLGQLLLAQKVASDADLGKVTDGLVLAIGVTQEKQNFEDTVIKVDFGATKLKPAEEAKIKDVARFVANHPAIVGVEIWGNADGDNTDLKYSKFRMEKGMELFDKYMTQFGAGDRSVAVTGRQNPNSTAARRGITFSFTVNDSSTGPDVNTVDYFLVPFLEDYVVEKRKTPIDTAELAVQAGGIVDVIEDLTDLNELKIATKLHDNLKKHYGADDPLVKALAVHIPLVRESLIESGVLEDTGTLGDASFKLNNGETQFAVGSHYVTFPFTGSADGVTVVDGWGQNKKRTVVSSTGGVLKIDLGFNTTKAGEYPLVITTSRGTEIHAMAVAQGTTGTGGGGTGDSPVRTGGSGGGTRTGGGGGTRTGGSSSSSGGGTGD